MQPDQFNKFNNVNSSLLKKISHRILPGVTSVLVACTSNSETKSAAAEPDTYKNIKEELKQIENPEIIPHADIDELEMEVNNGGFNQYFFNSSGQNCFETMKELRRKGKTRTAKLLEDAIKLINPNNLPEKDLIEKLRKRKVAELDDETINEKLNKLDILFYENPDGNLQ